MTAVVSPAPSAGAAVPRQRLDTRPLWGLVALAALALPLVGSGSTWLTLTVAGLAMGLIIFVIASGLTLVFGLMDVLNFGHGVFIALGAFVATSVLGAMGDWTGSAELWPKLSTSISPNTSVRPEAMMKMIMPMARPATVSVSQVEPEPMSGSTARASAGTSHRGLVSSPSNSFTPMVACLW